MTGLPAAARDAKRSAGRSAAAGAPEPSTQDVAAVPLADLLTRLHCTANGFAAKEAAAVLDIVGPNHIDAAPRKHLAVTLVERLTNPLVMILLFAAAVSAFTGDVASFVIITVIVLMSVVLDLTQEYQAQNAAARLRDQVAPTATVLRDGGAVEIAAADVVPGDIVLLAAGDLVPADARLTEARDLYVNEALLTGEAYPIEKEVAPPPALADAALPAKLVLMGSSVISGTGKAVVFATGRKAQLGTIASALRKPAPPTAFALGIQHFGMMIVKATMFLVLFVVLINLSFHRRRSPTPRCRPIWCSWARR